MATEKSSGKKEPESQEEEVRKEIERVHAIMLDFSKRAREAIEPFVNEVKEDIKKGEVNLANNKVQTTIMPLLFALPPANAIGVLDILQMDLRNSIARTRRPVEVKQKPSTTTMFG